MDCDSFFEILTSKKTLTAACRDHLQVCPRCRDLQEAIFPALTVLQNESSAGDLSPNSTRWQQPGFPPSNVETQAAEEHAFQAAAYLKQRVSAEQKNRLTNSSSRQSQWKFVAAFLAGMVASLGVAAVLRSEPTAPAIPAQGICIWQQHQTEAQQTPASNELILSCVECHLSDPGTT